jgi:hypothetical protein
MLRVNKPKVTATALQQSIRDNMAESPLLVWLITASKS